MDFVIETRREIRNFWDDRLILERLYDGMIAVFTDQRTILARLDTITAMEGTEVADLAALQAEAGNISSSIAGAVTALNDLSGKIAAGDGVSQADVDAITATLTGAQSSLDSAVSADDPAPAPVVTPAPAPVADPTAPVDGAPVVAPDPTAPDDGTATAV